MSTLVYNLVRGVRFVGRRTSQAWTTWLWSSMANVGRGFVMERGSYIVNPGLARIGDDVYIGPKTIFASELPTGSLTLGDGVKINGPGRIDCTGGLTVGDRTLFSDRVQLFTHDHGYDPRSTPRACPLEIGADVWVGSGALILQSVNEIGQGAVVAANAVVTKDVPPYTVVAGTPARVLREIPAEERLGAAGTARIGS